MVVTNNEGVEVMSTENTKLLVDAVVEMAGSPAAPGGLLTADDAALREAVRERYAELARRAGSGDTGCGCGCSVEPAADPITRDLYESHETAGLPRTAVDASLGCGNPTALAELRAGEVVLDLGSGAGLDVLLSARRVGPTGKAYGIDMTDEMLALARRNQAEAGVENAEFLRGHLEDVPLPDNSVDVVISNCVVNLSADKPQVLREAARVLRPGGRFAISDVIADPDMDDATRADMAAWTGCVAGALTRDEFERSLIDAGLVDIEIRETHRVHQHAAAAIVRARKP
jgi:SAM-dependent methyltransferase